jgi:protein-disulfide isomerase
MTSRPLTILALVGAVWVSATVAALGQTPDATREERLLTTLRRLYPATTFTRVQSTPIPGLYEVVLGNSVAYAGEDGRYFVFGHLFDLSTQRDLTVANVPALAPPPARVDFAALPLADAIKTVRGNGRRVLAVFSDPDCPYCQHSKRSLPSTIRLHRAAACSLHRGVRKPSRRCHRSSRAWRAVVPAHDAVAKTCAHRSAQPGAAAGSTWH